MTRSLSSPAGASARSVAPLLALLLVACGGGGPAGPSTAPEPTPEAPKAAETPQAAPTDAPPAPQTLAEEGAKPGEHGCGSCAVRICAAGDAISRVRVDLKLEVGGKDVRYDRALVRLQTADGRSEVAPLDPGKLSAGTAAVHTISAGKFASIKSIGDMKGGSGMLELRWTDANGPRARQFSLPLAIGSCP